MTDIENFVETMKRRWLAILMVFVIGFGAMLVAAKVGRTYKANADLLIVSEALKDTTLSDPDLPSILTSTEVLGRVIDRFKLDTNPLKLAKKIKIRLPAKSSILELSYEDRDGVKAAKIANGIADQSAIYFHDIATRGYTDVLKALNQRVKESQNRIASADRLLQTASASNFSASSDKALGDLITQIGELRGQSGQVNASLAADRSTAAALEHQIRAIEPIVHGEILQKDVVYQQLQVGLAKDVADLISERSSFRSTFPGLANPSRRVAREREQLKSFEALAVRNGAGLSPSYTQTIFDGERATALVGADRERLRATNAELASEQKFLQKVAGAGASVNTLKAKRDAAVQQYLTLTERLSQAQADAAAGASLGRLVVVSRAIPGPAELPLPLLAGLFALIVVLAIGAAYAWEAADRRLWGNREIEHVYGRPIFMEVGGRP
jgi:uncharacterized protein involved in exopolysaccharide biosynthesis